MAYDYPNSPTVGQVFQGLVWDGEKWASALNPTGSGAVRYDMPQGLSANQMAQGRANIGVTKKNYIINGAMQISQENGTTALNTNGTYPVDMFRVEFAHSASVGFQQLASVTPGGSPNRLQYNVGVTADPSVAAGDYTVITQVIEGLRIADLRLGTAAAKTFTLQFGVRAPAGTYCVTFANGTNNRAYVAEYVIAAGEANTDVVKTITIAGDVTGTWATDNTAGLFIKWCLMCGATFQQAAGSWAVATNTLGSPNQYNFMGTVNNIFQLFDVSFTEGTIAPPFQVPDYASELLACMRYYELAPTATGVATAGGLSAVQFKVVKRTNPTFVWVVQAGAATSTTAITHGAYAQFSATTALGYTANARL